MGWGDIEGWFSAQDAQFVIGMVQGVSDAIVVEVGFYAGRSTAAIAPVSRARNNTYYAIDNCAGSDPRDPATQNQQKRNMQQVFEDNMKREGLDEYVRVRIMDSSQAASLFEDGSVAVCFLDASHVAEDVARDIEAWWPKIRAGGVLGGHDWTWGSVSGAVRAFASANGLSIVAEGNCWKLSKPKGTANVD